jgi:DivIVA domain-containing protein
LSRIQSPATQRPGELDSEPATALQFVSTMGHTREAVAEREAAENDQARRELSPRAHGHAGSFSERELRVHVPAEIRDVSFPLAVRGYDRAAVDAYVKRVNHLIAELQMSRSPRAAVRHALDRAQEEVSGILQRAQATAEEITASARKEAEEGAARTSAQAAKVLVDADDKADRTRTEAGEVLAKAKAEAEKTLASARADSEEILSRSRTEGDERLQRSEKELAVLRELAEARMRELQAHTDTIWEERREMLDDISEMGARLTELAREAAARFPTREPVEQEGVSQPEAAEYEPSDVGETDATTRALAEVGLREERSGEASGEEQGT